MFHNLNPQNAAKMLQRKMLGWSVLFALLGGLILPLLSATNLLAAVSVFATSTAVNAVEAKASGEPAATILVSEWTVQCSQAGNTVITWVCPPLTNRLAPKDRLEAHVQLIPLPAVGPVSAAIAQPFSQTAKSDKAAVTAVVSGTGVLRFRVVVTVVGDSDLLLAGDYSTSLQTTLLAK